MGEKLQFQIICPRRQVEVLRRRGGVSHRTCSQCPHPPPPMLSHIWEGERKRPTVESAHSILRAQAMPKGTGVSPRDGEEMCLFL